MILRIFADEVIHCDNGILMGSVGLGASGDNQITRFRVGGKSLNLFLSLRNCVNLDKSQDLLRLSFFIFKMRMAIIMLTIPMSKNYMGN